MHDLKVDELEKEIIIARDRALDLQRKNVKLKKELFILQEEIISVKGVVEYEKRNIEYFKQEIYRLQEIGEDLAYELNKAVVEVKYWYAIKAPTLKTILKKYLQRIKQCVQ